MKNPARGSCVLLHGKHSALAYVYAEGSKPTIQTNRLPKTKTLHPLLTFESEIGVVEHVVRFADFSIATKDIALLDSVASSKESQEGVRVHVNIAEAAAVPPSIQYSGEVSTQQLNKMLTQSSLWGSTNSTIVVRSKNSRWNIVLTIKSKSKSPSTMGQAFLQLKKLAFIASRFPYSSGLQKNVRIGSVAASTRKSHLVMLPSYVTTLIKGLKADLVWIVYRM